MSLKKGLEHIYSNNGSEILYDMPLIWETVYQFRQEILTLPKDVIFNFIFVGSSFCPAYLSEYLMKFILETRHAH